MYTTNKPPLKDVVGLNVSTFTYEEVLNHICQLAPLKNPSYVCFANAHMAVEAQKNRKIATSVNNASLIASDGMSLVIALKYLHRVKQERASGMDMIFDVMAKAEIDNHSLFLFGSDRYILNQFINKAGLDYPRLKIAGSIAPPYKEFTIEQNNGFIEAINDSRANIVFVSLGCPKQELWMAENSRYINAVLLGLGAAIPLYANTTKRAPSFMQQNGIEWLFRLWQEPKRLWKRYLVTNSLFIFYFIRQLSSIKRNIHRLV